MDEFINKKLNQFDEIKENNTILYSKANHFDKKLNQLKLVNEEKLDEFIYFRRELGLLPQLKNCVNDIFILIDQTTESMKKIEQFFYRIEETKQLEKLDKKEKENQEKLNEYRLKKDLEFERIKEEFLFVFI